MMGDNAAPVPEISPAAFQAFQKILECMKPELFVILSKLICDVAKETGHGRVKIVVVKGWAREVTAEKYYREFKK